MSVVEGYSQNSRVALNFVDGVQKICREILVFLVFWAPMHRASLLLGSNLLRCGKQGGS